MSASGGPCTCAGAGYTIDASGRRSAPTPCLGHAGASYGAAGAAAPGKQGGCGCGSGPGGASVSAAPGVGPASATAIDRPFSTGRAAAGPMASARARASPAGPAPAPSRRPPIGVRASTPPHISVPLPGVPDRIAVRDPANPSSIIYMDKRMFDQLRGQVGLDRSQEVQSVGPPPRDPAAMARWTGPQ